MSVKLCLYEAVSMQPVTLGGQHGHQYFNVDPVCVSVRHGCDVTSATYTLGTRLQGLQ